MTLVCMAISFQENYSFQLLYWLSRKKKEHNGDIYKKT